MKKVRKVLAMGLAAILAMSAMNTFVFAEDISDAETGNMSEFPEDVNYITFSEYLEKYGEENVIAGFNAAEAKNKVEVLGMDEASVQSVSNEPNSVFESLSEGEFLGHELISVSDLPPDNIHFSVKINDNGFNDSLSATDDSSSSAVEPATLVTKTNYKYYYSDNQPSDTDLSEAYESTSGTYVYKYGYAYNGDYYCTTDVTFSNTQLKCGTQDTNMYVYLAAKSSSQTLDFGLMANPADSSRNQGMYACYNPGDGTFTVETYPKVAVTSSSNNVMTLADTTIQITLSVGTDGLIEMYMAIDGSMVYYLTKTFSNIVSGTSKALTFVQAMSCVASDGSNTSLTSGSYFKNVKFSNTKLYSYNSSSARTFSTIGSYTYYVFLAKPSKLSYSYTSSSETISISYT